MPAITFPPTAHYCGIQCSTAHITDADNDILWRASHCHEDDGDGEWVLFTGTGYLLLLSAWSYPLLKLKQLGLSRPTRRLVATLLLRHRITQVHLDAMGDVLPGVETFDW